MSQPLTRKQNACAVVRPQAGHSRECVLFTVDGCDAFACKEVSPIRSGSFAQLPQVGFTRLAAHNDAQLGQARVAVQSILLVKKPYEEDGPPEIGVTRFRAFQCASDKSDCVGQARG